MFVILFILFFLLCFGYFWVIGLMVGGIGGNLFDCVFDVVVG